LHIDIDGACSHIAWALGTKSINPEFVAEKAIDYINSLNIE
jgi:hypothetical protein